MTKDLGLSEPSRPTSIECLGFEFVRIQELNSTHRLLLHVELAGIPGLRLYCSDRRVANWASSARI